MYIYIIESNKVSIIITTTKAYRRAVFYLVQAISFTFCLYFTLLRDYYETNIDTRVVCGPCYMHIKPGIKLPQSDSEWANSDLFFRAELAMDCMNDFNINDVIYDMSNKVYNYFACNFGIIQRTTDVGPNFQTFVKIQRIFETTAQTRIEKFEAEHSREFTVD